MQTLELSKACKALGDPTRLRILRFLAQCTSSVAIDEDGDVRPVAGPTVGAVCCHITGIEKVSSTISFHMKELRESGLIEMERRGKQMICRVRPESLVQMRDFFAALLIPCCTPEKTNEQSQSN